MPNRKHLEIISQGVQAWNDWRKANQQIEPDLARADLNGKDLKEVLFNNTNLANARLEKAQLQAAHFRGANLSDAHLKGAALDDARMSETKLSNADLSEAQLNGARLNGAQLAGAQFDNASLVNATLRLANFRGASLHHAKLNDADLFGADLTQADFTGADLTGASLQSAILVETNFREAILTDCLVYGISAWNLTLDDAVQSNLVISRSNESKITVDNLEVAQFIYLLLNNARIRDVINTIGKKAVLLLGRFSPGRKEVLDAIAASLRQRNYLPIIFDFEKSQERDFTETIKILAGLSLFVIADITNPKSSPLELQATVPDYMIPFVTICQEDETPFSMFADLTKYPWVLRPTMTYRSTEALLRGLEGGIIKRALDKHAELMDQKVQALKTASIESWIDKIDK
jgi:uncharacterized protein YjbI with pentapeptide repeats